MSEKVKLSGKIPLLIIAGPTAVGKTSVAIETVRKFGGEIVSADSGQVYRYLDIGTAKPTSREMEKVKHHLIDIIEPSEQFSAAAYQKMANESIKEIHGKGKLPILCGGTGLYINAVTDNYVFSSTGKNKLLRENLEETALKMGLKYLYKKLQDFDPLSADKIHPHDKIRIIRALEVYYHAGKPISDQILKTVSRESTLNILFTALTMERAILYERINTRTETMIDKGLICEVQNLLKRYPSTAPGMQILGYRQCNAFLEEKLSFNELKDNIKKATRNYAKRQYTWFRRDERIKWFDISENDINPFFETVALFMKDNDNNGRII